MSTGPGREPEFSTRAPLPDGTQSHRICVGSESVASQRETVQIDGSGCCADTTHGDRTRGADSSAQSKRPVEPATIPGDPRVLAILRCKIPKKSVIPDAFKVHFGSVRIEK